MGASFALDFPYLTPPPFCPSKNLLQKSPKGLSTPCLNRKRRMTEALTPIFLISLPRSGSTLLQKILTTSPKIHTVSEPWVLLPLAFMCQPHGSLSTYGHSYYFEAFTDFVNTLAHGQDDFETALRDFVLSLYLRTAPKKGAHYFLDKTPRYYLIVPFLARVFPDAKFIFLFRNPLEVLASILTTWMQDRLFLYRHDVDLFQGPHALSQAYDNMADRAEAIQYSDLVTSPEQAVRKICVYLDIPFDSNMIMSYKCVRLKGQMGDQKIVNEEESITPRSLGKWRSILNTRYRKVFAKRYVQTLGNDTLRHFGVSVESLQSEIASISEIRRGSLQDLFFHSTSTIKRIFFLDHYKRLLKSVSERKRLCPHT